MFKSMTDTQKGIFLAIVSFTAFSFGDVFMKYLGQFYSPTTIAFFIAAYVLTFLTILKKKMGGFAATLKTSKWKLHLVRALCFALEFLLIIYGFSNLPMAVSYALIFLAPFIAPLISIPLLGIKPTRQQWVAIAIGFIGVLIILRPGLVPLSLPAIGLLIGAFFFAAGNVLVRKIEDGKQTLLSWAFYVEAVTVLITGAVYVSNPEPVTLSHLAILCGTAAFFMVGLLSISKAFLLAEPADAAPFQYIQILWGILFGYLIFGDIPDQWTLIGGTVIIGTGIWLVRHQKRPVIKDNL